MSGDFKSMNELLGDQVDHGQRMGFKSGGHVKTGQMTTKSMDSMDSMDHGVQPAKADGDSQAQKEAGGTKRLKPGYARGGRSRKEKPKVKKHGAHDKHGKHVGGPDPEKEYPKSKAGKKMPKDVKAKGGRAKKKWIKDAIKKPGALRKALGVKKGKDIPKGKLEKAAKKPGKMGRRARLAETLESFPKKARGGKVHNSEPMVKR